MARAMIILVFLWAVALGGYLLLKNIPKASPLYGLRDFFWTFLLACTTVVVLGIVALLTGIFTVGDQPFRQ